MSARRARRMRLDPPVVLLFGFSALTVVGAALLKAPGMTHQPIGWLDAWFTATSAVTVTGLAVVDTAQLSLAGQLVLLVLMEIGGLGLMTFATLMLVLLGGRVPLYQRDLVRSAFDQASLQDVLRLVRVIVAFALTLQGLGALLLAAAWVPRLGWAEGAWAAVFHAVSAFNNAGFSLWDDSLSGAVGDPQVVLVVAALIVVGGLGFTVIGEIFERRGLRGLSLQSRVILAASAALILSTLGVVALLEWDNPATLGALDGAGERWLAAGFHAVTTRSAGLHTVDPGGLGSAASLWTMLMMFVGGGPTSTTSGIKVTTFVVLFLIARAFLRGNVEPAILERRLSRETVLKAVTVTLAAMLLIFATLFGLCISERDADFLRLAFEAFSAFGTVGLSRAPTAELSPAGQVLIIVTMLLGRVGPVSLGFLLSRRTPRAVRYAEGHLQIG